MITVISSSSSFPLLHVDSFLVSLIVQLIELDP